MLGCSEYLGKILKDAKDIAGALRAFEKAQRDSDFKQKAIIEHGSCYLLANRIENAIVDFNKMKAYKSLGVNRLSFGRNIFYCSFQAHILIFPLCF